MVYYGAGCNVFNNNGILIGTIDVNNKVINNGKIIGYVEYIHNNAYDLNDNYIGHISSKILTYDNSTYMLLEHEDIVKKSDYESIQNVLDRIQTCLNSKNTWFSSGLCSRTCQVSCQRSCQLACQGCNSKQCHNQKCGTH